MKKRELRSQSHIHENQELRSWSLVHEKKNYRARPVSFLWWLRSPTQNTAIFLTYADNMHKKAQRTKSRELSCSNASRCVFINKQARWTMKHTSAVAANTKALPLIRSIKNHSKIFKMLQFENI